MKKCNSYKKTGIEWIGAKPKHWESTKVKFVGKSIISITCSPDDVVYKGQGILFLRSSNIQEGNKLTIEKKKEITIKASSSLKDYENIPFLKKNS